MARVWHFIDTVFNGEDENVQGKPSAHSKKVVNNNKFFFFVDLLSFTNGKDKICLVNELKLTISSLLL